MGGTGRVLIVGGGPAGLACAVALRRIGFQADVFEQAPRHPLFGSAFSIRSNSLKTLLRLGVGQQLLEKGAEYRSLDFYSSEGRLMNRLPEGEVADKWGPPSLAVLRTDLYQALMSELDPDTVHLNSRFVAAEQDDEGVTAHFEGGRTERGELLLGCDGARSIVREFVLSHAAPEYAGFACWRNVIVQQPVLVPRGEARAYIGRGRAAVMFPCSPEHLSMDLFDRIPADGTDPPGQVKAMLREMFAGWDATVLRAIEMADESVFSRTDLYERDPGPTWFKGRIVLLGDAIHPTTPFIGQGAGTAMEDGLTLAKELALARDLRDSKDVQAALGTYQWRRTDRVTWIVGAARRRGRLFGISHPVTASARDFALSHLPSRVMRRELERIVFYE